MATKKVGSKKKGKKRAATNRVVVVGRHHAPKKRKKATVGSTGARRKKKRAVGSMGTSKIKQIGMMAIGVAVGAGITHIVLRPVEKHLTDKWPMVGKFIAAGEVFLGGMIAIGSKKDFVKSIGVGILAGGVHGLMKQVNVYKDIPKINGVDDFHHMIIPLHPGNNVSGLIRNSANSVRTSQVAGLGDTSRTSRVAGAIYGEEYESAFDAPLAKGL